MPENHDIQETYVIPPNFIETGTVMSGRFKMRNVIEAAILVIAISYPVFQLGLSLTTRIIILCLTALPAGLAGLIGISGESLSSFIINFFRYLTKRRIVGTPEETDGIPTPSSVKQRRKEDKQKKVKAAKIHDEFSSRDSPSEIAEKKAHRTFRKDVRTATMSDYIPIEKIEHGIIYTRDHRYVKIIEVVPINFLLRSAREQRNIIYSFISYCKISPVRMQLKVMTRKADINRHLETVRREMEHETDKNCRTLQEDYLRLIRRVGSKDAVTRRFFIIFEAELYGRKDKGTEEAEALGSLQTAVNTARTYLRQCGNEVIEHDNEDEFTTDVLYNMLNRKVVQEKPLSVRANEVTGKHLTDPPDSDGNPPAIPAADFFAPQYIDFNHGRYIKIDGTYYSYLLIPSSGYKSQVCAGWLSLLVNAGDGIDLDLYAYRQPKERMVQKLGQQLRINRSRIKEASDTNTNFDDISDAIQSGYFLKNGLANNEDFYYVSILITITADSEEEMDWRVRELKKLLISQDMDVSPCIFRQEQAFLSSLPLVTLDKMLFERSKRNVLTLGLASFYPFTSFEMCDDNGILLGVNKHNSSLIIVDIMDGKRYKNGNIAVAGCSGAGKTVTIQTIALRLRRKNVQVFLIAPLKGHEMHRACTNIGGTFIQISPGSPHCINAMEIRKSDHSANDLLDGPQMDRSELAAKIQRLHIFFSLLIPDMSHEEKQLLDDALIRTYALKGITHDNNSLWDPDRPGEYREMPVLGDLYSLMVKKVATKRMANILNRLVNGSASSFNGQTNVDLENKYIVLDISELTGDLLTVGMFLALDYVWSKAKEDRTKEKAIIIDEVWQLIGASSNRLAAESVLEIAKIARGYGCSAIFATQDLNDFFALDDGKYGKGIINNCKTKIILNLEEEEAQRVQDLLHLSEAEVMEITHFERGNGLISTNGNNIPVKFLLSDLEKELITTDRQELKALLLKKQNVG